MYMYVYIYIDSIHVCVYINIYIVDWASDKGRDLLSPDWLNVHPKWIWKDNWRILNTSPTGHTYGSPRLAPSALFSTWHWRARKPPLGLWVGTAHSKCIGWCCANPCPTWFKRWKDRHMTGRPRWNVMWKFRIHTPKISLLEDVIKQNQVFYHRSHY